MAGAIVSQSTLEALDTGSGPKGVRTSQAAMEVVRNDLTPLVRTSQAAAEVLHNDAVFHIRISQACLEVLHDLNSTGGYVSLVGTAR